MLHSEILPQTSKKNLHRLICHICDISQLCTTPYPPSFKMSSESDPDEDSNEDADYREIYDRGYDRGNIIIIIVIIIIIIIIL